MDCKGIWKLVVIYQFFYLVIIETSEAKKRMEKEHFVKAIAEVEWLPEQTDCPGEHDKKLVQPDIPWGTPGRAYLTAPPEIDIYRSKIPNAGLGAMATTFIPKHTWLGEYEGVTIIPSEVDYISWYAWTVYRGSHVLRYIDGGELETSNWPRFVNMPNNVYDENVNIQTCYDRMYYQASKDIYPGQELLVHYGESYAKTLGIFDELELSDAIRSAEIVGNDDEDIAQLAVELKRLMGQKGANITNGLKALLGDNNSALSRTFGEQLKSSLSKETKAESVKDEK